jgi:ubiquinone/menaquinone biosynthesis C-methylase UbiE
MTLIEKWGLRRARLAPRLLGWCRQPHYVRDYRRRVRSLLSTKPEVDAMNLAVGGEFHAFGSALKDLTVQAGLKDGMTLVDVGCGSGRLAYALRSMKITYIGSDVVTALVRYAKRICNRPDWRFEVVVDLKIPASDNSVDMVVFISVFTHLRHEETFVYLLEAMRVLKPAGLVVFTFFDFSQPNHWIIFERYVETIRSSKPTMHVEQFIDKGTIAVWAEKLGFRIKQLYDGAQNYIKLGDDIVRDDGSKVSGAMTIGQSACVLEKT